MALLPVVEGMERDHVLRELSKQPLPDQGERARGRSRGNLQPRDSESHLPLRRNWTLVLAALDTQRHLIVSIIPEGSGPVASV